MAIFDQWRKFYLSNLNFKSWMDTNTYVVYKESQ